MQNFMNKGSTKKFFSTLAILSLVMPGVLLQAPFQQEARAVGVAAGTVIGNQATAKYKDINNNPYNSTSNLVTTTVATIYGVTLTPNGDLPFTVTNPGQQQNATPGTIVYYPYVLTNTGNGPDTYAMTSPVDTTIGTRFTPANKKVYFDANGNGVVDVGDTLIADGTATVSVPADTSIKLIVEYQVPSTGVASGQVANVDLIANSVGDLGATLGTIVDSNNYNKTTIVNDAVITVSKSVDKATVNPSTVTPAVDNELIYTLDVGNTGNQAADDIFVVDSIPANTVFKVNSATAPAGVQITYSTLATGDATTFTATPAGTYDPLIKRIRYVMNTANGGKLAPANNRAFTFAVRVNENSPSVNILNSAEYQYKENGGTVIKDDPTDATPEGDTNTVTTLVNKKAAAQISFSAAPFSGSVPAGTENPIFPAATSDRTTIASTPAGSYIYFKNAITNNGNATDTFNIAVDSAASTIPTGAIVSFFILTDGATATNNTSPLLDTNGDSIPDTSSMVGLSPRTTLIGAETSVPTTAVIAPTPYSIVTRVFIPASAVPANAPVTVVVKSTSTNGGTAIAATGGQNLTDTTANILTAISAPKTDISNIFGALTNDETTRSLTQTSAGATVSYPLNVRNAGSGSDTFNLSIDPLTTTLPAGSTVTYYPLIPASTTTIVDTSIAAGDNSIDLASTAGFVSGDTIIINGKTLTVNSVTSTTVTFGPGETLGSVPANGSAVVERGNTPITATNVIPAGGSQQILAVVVVVTDPSTAANSYDITFKSTSTNNTTFVDSITDTLVVPNFRTFTLQADRTGSVPPGGTLFYTHTLTNTGNIAEEFKLTLPLNSNGLDYQLIVPSTTLPGTFDVVTTAVGSNSEFTTPSVPIGGTYVFQVKVSAPSNAPINTVSSILLTAKETDPAGGTITNTDVTTVVEGFISLTKSVLIYDAATGATGGTLSTTIPAGTAKPGEVLEYTINYQNIGSQTAREVAINDLIPANTTYVAGSLVINGVAKTDAIGPETDPTTGSAQHVAMTGTTFFVGVTATDTVGGNVVQGGSGFVKFRVRVNAL